MRRQRLIQEASAPKQELEMLHKVLQRTKQSSQNTVKGSFRLQNQLQKAQAASEDLGLERVGISQEHLHNALQIHIKIYIS